MMSAKLLMTVLHEESVEMQQLRVQGHSLSPRLEP